jgi:hypothetical protein
MNMQVDLRTLCRALGFTVVVVHGQGIIRRKNEASRRAVMFADLIEAFCVECGEGPVAEPREGLMAVVTRMAQGIVEVMREQGGECRPEDLLTKGFARDQVERHWQMAQALARVMLNEPPPPLDS